MQPHLNPYTPGAGTRPLVIAGRASELTRADSLLKAVKLGAAQRSLMLYGLRGVGKTVLLNEMERISEAEGYIGDHLEMSEKDDFRKVMAKSCRRALLKVSSIEAAKDKALNALRVLKAFTLSIPDGPEFRIDVDAALGQGDSGDLDSDLTDLLLALGEAASERGRHVCFFIDEVQYLKEKEFGALIAASHRISQKACPIVFICAGLPQVAALSGDAKSYAERLFDFLPIDTLPRGEDEMALLEPARGRSVEYCDQAKDLILRAARGYPYFIQEFGSYVWNEAGGSPISLADATEGCRKAVEAMDRSFFKVRMDRSTTAERNFMKAMASLPAAPYKTADVASKLGKQTNSIGPVRATLIGKGFIYSPQHGELAFTVPMFDRGGPVC
jgi:hypothetical protein